MKRNKKIIGSICAFGIIAGAVYVFKSSYWRDVWLLACAIHYAVLCLLAEIVIGIMFRGDFRKADDEMYFAFGFNLLVIVLYFLMRFTSRTI